MLGEGQVGSMCSCLDAIGIPLGVMYVYKMCGILDKGGIWVRGGGGRLFQAPGCRPGDPHATVIQDPTVKPHNE